MSQNDFHPDWICTCGDLTTLGVVHRKDVPCYYPDKREWVGLTHDEVDSWELPDCPTVFEFVQFIESKLKEKNNG